LVRKGKEEAPIPFVEEIKDENNDLVQRSESKLIKKLEKKEKVSIFNNKKHYKM